MRCIDMFWSLYGESALIHSRKNNCFCSNIVLKNSVRVALGRTRGVEVRSGKNQWFPLCLNDFASDPLLLRSSHFSKRSVDMFWLNFVDQRLQHVRDRSMNSIFFRGKKISPDENRVETSRSIFYLTIVGQTITKTFINELFLYTFIAKNCLKQYWNLLICVHVWR